MSAIAERPIASTGPIPSGRSTYCPGVRLQAIRAHDALGACLRPAHTRYDGDTVFVVACGEREVDVDLVQQATFVAVGRAVASAVAS